MLPRFFGMMKTFRPVLSPPELEFEPPDDEGEELHAAARIDSRTSIARRGRALLLCVLCAVLIDESFQL